MLCFSLALNAQKNPGALTVEQIMQDQKWIGTSPSNPYWSADGRYLFFYWNPEKETSDSLYYISLADKTPRKATAAMQQQVPAFNSIVYNQPQNAYAYVKDGDLFYTSAQQKGTRITQTVEPEAALQFIADGKEIAFLRNGNVYSWNIATGLTTQLTNFVKGTAPKEVAQSAQEKWLEQDAIRMSEVLQERKQKRTAAEAYSKSLRTKDLRTIYIEDKIVSGTVISPDGRFVTYRLSKQPATVKTTIVPSYVTESGFTTDISARTKVGTTQPANELYIFDREQDTVLFVIWDSIPGIADKPDYVKDYPAKDTAQKTPANRAVSFRGPVWNERGTSAVIEVRSADNKDRWIMLLDAATATLKNIDRQRDEAWVGGPGTYLLPIWLDENTILYQSEKSGYSHVYKTNVHTGVATQITKGNFEVNNLQLSNNKKTIYFTANMLHPGDYQFYQMPVSGGTPAQITKMTGINRVALSPNEKHIAVLYSYSNKPWELFVQENKKEAKWEQVTRLAQSGTFKQYAWKDPEIVTFTARDGATVYARLYKPDSAHAAKPAVIFVHGAGYLQNVHKGWSTYSREYLFHNLLAGQGYTVLDIDYRGSEGYGRAWRTGIYRHMGGKDLTDQVDGAAYLVKQHGVNASKIGIYGGSYGGFITLMAMFTQPDVFAAGAALRSVTDWAHYNHPYTANILNEPAKDSIAYKRSSPIYFAEGLKGHLLMCHGMIDVNVHFQDIVRLTQRLIELKKENWELAVYPLEDHGFVEPSSWTDEYRRILKLFNGVLKR